MSNTWIEPKIIIGNTATGDYYFPCPQEQGESHVFISPFLKAFWKNDNPIYDGI